MKIWQFPMSKSFIDLEAIQVVLQPAMQSADTYGFLIVVALQPAPVSVTSQLSTDPTAAAQQKKEIDDEMAKLVAAWQGIVAPEVVVPLDSLQYCQVFEDKLHLVLTKDSSANLGAMLESMDYKVLPAGDNLVVERKLLEKIRSKLDLLKLNNSILFKQLKQVLS